jgi:glycosyltransferase involved in cell wall biosynthesis
MRITHVITGLNVGGAETMLYRLICHMDRGRFDTEVISLTDLGPIGKQIQDLGISVRCLSMNRKAPNPLAFFQLSRLLRKSRPQVVQTWMMHSDLLGGLAALVAGRFPVVWGVHQMPLDPAFSNCRSKMTVRCCVKLSTKIPSKIVCCSNATMNTYAALGYPRGSMVVIPNGFDLTTLYRDDEGGKAIRAELDLSENTPIVGLVARFHPQKDHMTFFRAADLLIRRLPAVHFVLCGDGVTLTETILRELVASSASPGSFHLLGRRNDVRRVISAFTVATLASASEAFPLSIGEAMCCETTCVATDVGDVRKIVGTTGRIVPAGNAVALSQAWFDLLSMSSLARRNLGRAARDRVGRKFSLRSIVSKYQTLYEEVGDSKSDVICGADRSSE